MYNPQGFPLQIFQSRHALHPEETWIEGCERVGHHVATAEVGPNLAKYCEAFVELLQSNEFMPGGRIWYGSGRPKGQLLNCVSADTLVHTRDGLRSASELVDQEVQVLSEGGVYRPARWYCYGAQRLFRIVFDNGDELFATEGHEWIVTDPKGGSSRTTTDRLQGRRVPIQHVVGFSYNEEEWAEGVRHGLTYGDGSLYMGGRFAQLRQFGDSKELIPMFFEKWSHYEKIDALVANRLPARFKQLPSGGETASYLRGFIAGFIAADGCVDSRGHVMAHQANLEALTRIRQLAASVGIPSASIRRSRELNPWTGETAPLWKLSFVKPAFMPDGEVDEHLILKSKHRDYMHVCPTSSKRPTRRVELVEATDRVELVYCCVEPETHSMVIGPGYLTGQCFVIPTSDSREGWGRSTSDLMIISGTGGGVGINFSPIRPRNSLIHGTGGYATGAVSLMRIKNAVGEELKAGGGRRVAMMHALSLTHPDLEEFLDAKLEKKALNNANVSIVFDESPEDFFDLVKSGKNFDLKFGGRVHGQRNAQEIWERIIRNAIGDGTKDRPGGEPGLLNGFLANRMSNVYYFAPLICTNPCGEIWLPAYDCCDLGSLVLPRFVSMGTFLWNKLKDVVKLGVRFLDNVLTVNQYPLNEIKEVSAGSRRIGLGVMGLSTMLLQLGYRYDSPAALEFVDKLMNTIKNAAYEASVELAIEKGPFPKFEADKFLRSGFCKTLKPSLRAKIQEHGIRNCATMTLPPTGTTAMIADVDSGIEPSFGPGHVRAFRDGEDLKRETVIHPLFQKMVEEGKDTSHFITSYDISMRSHFEMQRTCQRHVDNAVSKTINLAPGTSPEELSELYMEFLPDLKGVTVYPEGSREDQPITPLSREEATRIVLEKLGSSGGALSADSCRIGGDCG